MVKSFPSISLVYPPNPSPFLPSLSLLSPLFLRFSVVTDGRGMTQREGKGMDMTSGSRIKWLKEETGSFTISFLTFHSFHSLEAIRWLCGHSLFIHLPCLHRGRVYGKSGGKERYSEVTSENEETSKDIWNLHSLSNPFIRSKIRSGNYSELLGQSLVSFTHPKVVSSGFLG